MKQKVDLIMQTIDNLTSFVPQNRLKISFQLHKLMGLTTAIEKSVKTLARGEAAKTKLSLKEHPRKSL